MFSPNMLKTFQSCPLKYLFKYVEKISTPQKANFFEKGKKIHALAHYYLRGDDITKFEPTLSIEEKQIWEILKANKYFQKKYINSEYNLACRVDKFWIGGRLDAVVFDNDTYYILDYKTGQIPKNPEFDFQTMVYLLALSENFKTNNIKFVYIDLKNNQNVEIEFSEENKCQYIQKIKEICNKITTYQKGENVDFSKVCDFCEFNKICI